MIKLNIAAGPNVFANNWINYDIVDISNYLTYLKNASPNHMSAQQNVLAASIKNTGIDFRIHDLNKGFPQHSDNSVDLIVGNQMIEHLNIIYETPKFVKECYRMLKPGGICRFITPDLDILLKSYYENNMDRYCNDQPEFYKNADRGSQLCYLLFGASGPTSNNAHYEGHHFIFNQISMTKIMQEAGFKKIEFYYESGVSKSEIIIKETVDTGLSHSLIVEGIK